MWVQPPEDKVVSAAGRRKRFVLVLVILALATLVVALLVLWKTSREEIISCASYDSQIWAQSLFQSDLSRYAALDPDSNSLACQELPLGAALCGRTRSLPERSRQSW